MSHALSRLRWAFHDPLFVRMPRGLQPTALADEIAPALTEGLALIRAGFERKTFDPGSSTRTFTIAMADIAEAVHLPHLLRGLREAPSVRIRAINMPAAQRRAALADGQVDLALANVSAQRPVRAELLGEHGYVTVARAGHPYIRSRLTLAHFRKAKHLLVGGTRHGEVIERALRRPNVNADIAMQVSSFYSVRAIIMQSDLIATIPPGIAREIARTATMRLFEPPIPLPRARIFLWWHERYHRDPGNTWLRELYLREVRPLYGAR